MKNSCLIAALAASVLWMGLAGTPAAAQAPGTQFVAPTVALVDVNYIFKNHPRFKAQMEEMRVSVTNSQTEWKRQKEGLTKLVERLQEFRAGTPDYQQMEEQIVGEKTRLSTKMQLEQKAFLQREAKIYYDIYQEISQEVQYICQQKGITLVMNFNGDQDQSGEPGRRPSRDQSKDRL